MKLKVKDRLTLLGLLPKEGDFISLKVVRQLQNDLSFSEKEIKRYKFRQEGSIVKWDEKIAQEKEIEIGDKAKEIIANALKEMNEKKKLTLNSIDLYERFVEKNKGGV